MGVEVEVGVEFEVQSLLVKIDAPSRHAASQCTLRLSTNFRRIAHHFEDPKP